MKASKAIKRAKVRPRTRIKVRVYPVKSTPTSDEIGWRVRVGKESPVPYAGKGDAVAYARREVRFIVGRGLTATLVICKENGRIQEERTYPKSSDPRRRKG